MASGGFVFSPRPGSRANAVACAKCVPTAGYRLEEFTSAFGSPLPPLMLIQAKGGQERLESDTPATGKHSCTMQQKKRPEFSGRSLSYMLSHFLNICFVVSLLIAAIDVVSGMPFGQARTQFCELPQPSMPPSSISVSSRSSLFISPVG